MKSTNQTLPPSKAFEVLRRLLMAGAALALIGLFMFSGLSAWTILPQWSGLSPEIQFRLAAAWIPVPVYAWAIWEARRVFARLNLDLVEGYSLLGSALNRIGLALAVTAVFSGVVGLYLVLTVPGGSNARFTSAIVPHVALCIVGLGLAAIGHLLKRADALRNENLALKAELEDFL